MVYEVKCSECGEIIDFGGREPSNFSAEEKLPEGAIEFRDEVFCEDCVKKFVQFGIGDVEERIDDIENNLKEVMEILDIDE